MSYIILDTTHIAGDVVEGTTAALVQPGTDRIELSDIENYYVGWKIIAITGQHSGSQFYVNAYDAKTKQFTLEGFGRIAAPHTSFLLIHG